MTTTDLKLFGRVILGIICLQILAFVLFFLSFLPKRIYHSSSTGQKVEVFYAGQGAFGLDNISVRVNGEEIGRRGTTYSPGKITNVDIQQDSIVVHYKVKNDTDTDTCVIRRTIKQ